MKRYGTTGPFVGAVLVGLFLPWSGNADDSTNSETAVRSTKLLESDGEGFSGRESRTKQNRATRIAVGKPDKADKPDRADKPDKADKPGKTDFADKGAVQAEATGIAKQPKPTEVFLEQLFANGPQNERLSKMRLARSELLSALRENGHFTDFLGLLERTGFDKTLHGKGPFTVFAPSDEAFAKLPRSMRETLARDPGSAKSLLAHHVVRGLVTKNVLDHLRNVKTMSGGVVNIDYQTGIRINHGHIFSFDQYGSNGVFHGIDEVLLLPERAQTKSAKNNRISAPTS